MGRHLQFGAAGAGFVLPLLLVADELVISLYFFAAAFACLAASRVPWSHDLAAGTGFGMTTLACAGNASGLVPPTSVVLLLSAAAGVTNVALLDAAAAANPSMRHLLGLQSTLAVGNAVPLFLSGFGVGERLLVSATGVACAAATMLAAGRASRSRDDGATGSRPVWLALCAGLATAVQLGLVAAADILADEDMARAVWIGTSFGIVAGRISGTLAVRWLTWRRAAGLALASAMSTLLLSRADGVPVAAFWALLSAALVAPVFPLVLATSYGAVDALHRQAHRRRLNLRAGPVTVAVSIATSGVVPLLLTGAEPGRAASVLFVAAVLLAVLLVRLPALDARRPEEVRA